MPIRLYTVSFDVQLGTAANSVPASTTSDVSVSGPTIQLRPGDKVRAQHLVVYASETSRKVQLFGGIEADLEFFTAGGVAVDSMAIASFNPTTADATIVPIDAMVVVGQDDHFLQLANLQFGPVGSGIVSQVAALGTAHVHNSDAGAAHIVTMGILGVIEVETED